MIVTDKEILEKPSEIISLEEAPALVSKLEQELKESAIAGFAGIGLAAPQIGIHKQVAIVRIQNDKKPINIDLVNAKIEKSWDLSSFPKEGCLSIPGVSGTTRRYKEILVSNEVEPKKFIATGLLAIVIQHELDHLNGILMTERMLNGIDK